MKKCTVDDTDARTELTAQERVTVHEVGADMVAIVVAALMVVGLSLVAAVLVPGSAVSFALCALGVVVAVGLLVSVLSW